MHEMQCGVGTVTSHHVRVCGFQHQHGEIFLTFAAPSAYSLIELQTIHRFYHKEGPFSWLKVPTSAFSFKTLLRHSVGALSVIVETDGLFAALLSLCALS